MKYGLWFQNKRMSVPQKKTTIDGKYTIEL
jgi:hypothetical protein